MCPLCIGSTVLLLTGASSAGGLALIAARVVGAGSAATRAADSTALDSRTIRKDSPDGPSAREPDL